MQTDPTNQNPETNSGTGNPPTGETTIDLDKILLPKKETPPPSTQRINAGILLEQEQGATLKALEVMPGKERKPEPAPAPVPVPPKKPETPTTQPLQTYKGDIEHLVETKNISVVTIAAAEAERRGTDVQAANEEFAEKAKNIGKKTLIIFAGLALLTAAGGSIAYVFLRETPTAQIVHNSQAPFILVDSTQIVPFQAGDISREAVMGTLEAARTKVGLSLGLVERLYPAAAATSTNGAPVMISVRTILSTISATIPGELVRSIDPFYYTLGVHAFDENQSFLIIHIDAYELAYNGMLSWERTMYNDLQPLFKRTPSPRTLGEQATTTPPVQLLQTVFADRVVENRETRAVQNEVGDLLLLWTFLDRSTIAITTNEHTLREIITRFVDLTTLPQI